MKQKYFAMVAVLFGVAVAFQPAGAEGILKRHHARPECEPGYKIVEETVLQDVTRTVCKMVPETKKKWVYDWVPDPFCIRDTKHGECPNCSGPYCRKQLVKIQVEVPCPTLKCVTQTITEKVPVIVYRKVPIAHAETIPAAPTPKK